ncbi:haloacid dehalogenase-like hydrolase [Ferrimonas sp. SCSIO 43195]|uniref:haloacid dehalogenase-like hydrolase n=1 Tax=Ferrimonas sp. SCSIO 43195 TaxID=2822844 RepID=UPI002075DE47|nr:haloacid dehalogenase-like hydrolase [Ferrimonas sp. SCSIO 43195]USD36070.1 hypothetical protein J8Z22_13590 [Ferrimonas sp. SCSIO 43195]
MTKDVTNNQVLGLDEFREKKRSGEDYRQTPEQALQNLAQLPDSTPLLVDFDDTLWLRNSTELFLASVAPKLLISIVLQLLDLLRPWRWIGGQEQRHYRDLIRIKVVLFVAPWAKRQWQKQAAEVGGRYLNRELYDLLLSRDNPIYLLSYGFDFILAPLLDAMGCEWPLVVSSKLGSAIELRIKGKGAMAIEALGRETVRRSACVTDSLLDRDLLESCSVGIWVQWPESVAQRAGLDPMLPFVYLKKVKRPTESYFTRAILGHDYLTLLLVFAIANPYPWQTAACLLGFVLAYFCAYEVGYFENDRLGLRYEDKPKVSDNYRLLAGGFRPWFAWMWALVLAVFPAWLAAQGSSWLPEAFALQGAQATLLVWAVFVAFLVVVRCVFAWFNRIRETGRVVPMLILQLARTAGYLVLFSTSIVGVLFCVSHGLAKWIPYVVYRFGGSRKGMPNHLFNLLILVLLLGAVAISGGLSWQQLTQWHALVILAYAGLRAAKDLFGFRAHLSRLGSGD